MNQPLMVRGIVVHGKWSRGKWQISDEELTRVVQEARRHGAYEALTDAAGDAHSAPFLTRWWDLEGWLQRKAEGVWR